MRITPQTTLLDFVMWYCNDLKIYCDHASELASRVEKQIKILTERDNRAKGHDRAVRTALREIQEDEANLTAEIGRRDTFREMLEEYLLPLTQGGQQ